MPYSANYCATIQAALLKGKLGEEIYLLKTKSEIYLLSQGASKNTKAREKNKENSLITDCTGYQTNLQSNQKRTGEASNRTSDSKIKEERGKRALKDRNCFEKSKDRQANFYDSARAWTNFLNLQRCRSFSTFI